MEALNTLLVSWKEECADRLREPGGSGDAWADERLEYAFSLGASTGDGEVVLDASRVGYAGGHLDWNCFDINATVEASHGLTATSWKTRPAAQVLPVPLAYAGMPASRWWEFEEGAVYFGGIEAGPSDIGRLIVAEYATVYSDDWFLVPVRLPVGVLVRIRRITLLDTFGETHTIKSTAVLDDDGLPEGAERPWAFFELAGDPSAAEGKTPLLFLPPALTGSMNGRPVEQVGFVRDEGANLGWAIESTIEAPTGRPLKRRLQWGLAKQAMADAEQDEPEAAGDADEQPEAWRYRLQTEVPPYWIPLLPEAVEPGSAQVRLRRARMLAWDEIDLDWAKGPKGRILAPDGPLRLFEEEIPRGGLEVTRSWQLARGSDGDLHLWMARRKRPGRGERATGLAYDTMER